MLCFQSHLGFETGNQAQHLGSWLLLLWASQVILRIPVLHVACSVTSLPFFAWQILANATFSRKPPPFVGRPTLPLCPPRAILPSHCVPGPGA